MIDPEELRRAARLALARRDFITFAQLMEPTYAAPPHIRLIAEHLQKLAEGEIRRLIILMPPRSGKSWTCTQLFPAWYLGRNPAHRVIITAHTATLAESFSIAVRDIIDGRPAFREVFAGVRVSANQRAAFRWALHGYRDTMIAAGVGGGITGYGAHLLVIDDPVKNFEEAVSPSVQERNWMWYTTTARTRLVGEGKVLVVMTHWSEGDLAGRILDSPEGKDFRVLALPAESLGTWTDPTCDEAYVNALDPFSRKYVFPDALGRPRGTPLWPEMGYDREFLQRAKALLGYQYQGLYQCSPVAPQGNMFERANIRAVTQAQLVEEGYKVAARVRSYDLAFSADEHADATVGLLLTVYHKEGHTLLVVEDCARWRAEWNESAEKILAIAQQDGKEVVILVEAVASQNVAFKSLRRDPRLAMHHIIPITPDKDKVSRAQYTMRWVGLKALCLLYPSPNTPPPWADGFIEELNAFPFAAHDDRVDALTQAVNYLQPLLDSLLSKGYNVSENMPERPRRRFGVFDELGQAVETVRDRLVWRVN